MGSRKGGPQMQKLSRSRPPEALSGGESVKQSVDLVYNERQTTDSSQPDPAALDPSAKFSLLAANRRTGELQPSSACSGAE